MIFFLIFRYFVVTFFFSYNAYLIITYHVYCSHTNLKILKGYKCRKLRTIYFKYNIYIKTL